MKLYLLTLLVLSSFLTYKAQGIRPGKVALSARNHQDIIKISSVKGSVQDDQLLAKSAKVSSGLNRKLMTKITPSSTITSNLENQKNKHDPKPEDKSTHQLVGKEETPNSLPENSKHSKKDVITEQYPDVTDIAEMDYTPARKKSPIHN
ncbi:hypothetical protein L1987_31184 [Smallanthus sonchifolius]|uniref:Uncharacterized protein n=1 Tax=Smallanthus sonchifolius TaxID=185202 RepID=A0ACB9I6D8_9ASTR|nr:hypothetical protein L1987_31184 [Smallanthus sonchifolius]